VGISISSGLPDAHTKLVRAIAEHDDLPLVHGGRPQRGRHPGACLGERSIGLQKRETSGLSTSLLKTKLVTRGPQSCHECTCAAAGSLKRALVVVNCDRVPVLSVRVYTASISCLSL
jgi:hypothetical protein